jgi:hypothetical protein
LSLVLEICTGTPLDTLQESELQSKKVLAEQMKKAILFHLSPQSSSSLFIPSCQCGGERRRRSLSDLSPYTHSGSWKIITFKKN